MIGRWGFGARLHHDDEDIPPFYSPACTIHPSMLPNPGNKKTYCFALGTPDELLVSDD